MDGYYIIGKAERIESGWLRRDIINNPQSENYGHIEAHWCTGPDDRSPLHNTTDRYEAGCAWCWLGYPHTEDEHAASLRP